ncbi:MAG: hypothetical protein JRG94_13340, partial [Deltaproteobacteria bacterium]|nr:hypothetical protein [Deltaproteobacteria bacterium]
MTILLSIRDLSDVIDRQGSVGYSDEAFDSVDADPENPIALVKRDEERVFLKNLFEKRFKNRAPNLRRRSRRVHAEKLFRLRHAQRRLESAGQALACVRFGDDEIGGEVGLFDSADGQCEVSCILGDSLLGKRVLPLPIAGLRAVI